MSAVLTAAALRAALLHVAGRLDGAADELNARDAAVGDGDLGVTVVRGARGITEALPSAPDDIGALLLQCAQAFTKTSGSTFGTLVATGLMAAGKATRGKSEIPWSDVSPVLGDALTAMAARGKAQLGDKTMLDGVEALRRATQGQTDPAAMLSAAVTEVKRALDDLRDKPARQGRARIFAEKTVGSDDPGMIVVQRIVEELAHT
jgi:dihydroxyacetone kinase-like protein